MRAWRRRSKFIGQELQAIVSDIFFVLWHRLVALIFPHAAFWALLKPIPPCKLAGLDGFMIAWPFSSMLCDLPPHHGVAVPGTSGRFT